MLPAVHGNVTLIKGWFDQTLPPFLAAHPDPVSFLHIDCDTYSSTKTILDMLFPRLRVGTVILFDEYFGYRGWRHEEWKAWQEYVSTKNISYEYIAYSNAQVGLLVKAIPE